MITIRFLFKNITVALLMCLILTSFFLIPVNAQKVLLEQDVNADTIIPSKGPNRKFYKHYYAGIAFVAGPDSAGSKINYGFSKEVYFGLRHKFKISNFYAFGTDLLYRNVTYSLKQDSGKIFPNAVKHDKERLAYNIFALGVYNRFNIGKRGNYIGNFIDLGARVNWAFNVIHFTKDKLDTVGINNGGVVKVRTSKLVYTQPLYYDVFGRIGFNRYVITFSYRLTGLFKPEYDLYNDMPKFLVGFEVGLHK